jgi:class 3 adenylate cyclase
LALILCIEDEEPLRRLITAELRDAGYETIEAADGRAGLAAIREHQPDLVLCDVNMPGMNGYELLSQLRDNHPHLAEAPFVFLSALADRRDVIAGKRLGADDYLTKPVDIEVLIATVEARLMQVERLERRFDAERALLESQWREAAQQAQAEHAQTMRLFSSHVSEAVANELLRQRDNLLKTGRAEPQLLTATVLFCDIGGYSQASERLDLHTLMRWLGGFMEPMAKAVMRHHGVVDKFIGDAIMAVFGVPAPRTDDAEIDADVANAVACARDMWREVEALNARWLAEGLPEVDIGVGIHTGPVLAGCIGSAERMEYTVIGDTVNTAHRLQTYAREIGGPDSCVIVAGDTTWQRLRGRVPGRAVGEVRLRGKAKPVTAHRIEAGGLPHP